jgi:hypothetical protein
MQAFFQFVRIADFSMAVAVVNHVVAGSPQIWGLMVAISEVYGCSARELKQLHFVRDSGPALCQSGVCV